MVKNPLIKCVSLSFPIFAVAQGLQLELQKHKLAQGVQEIIKRDAGQNLNMNLIDKKSFYSVELEVGTPPQKITVAVDTGSSDTWIISSQNPFCKLGTNSTNSGNFANQKRDSAGFTTDPVDIYLTATLPNDFYGSWATQIGDSPSNSESSDAIETGTLDCSNFGVFDLDSSLTFEEIDFPSEFASQYADGSQVQGIYFTDNFLINGISIPNITAALAMETDMSMGILGLSYEASESSRSNANSSLQFTYPNFPSSLKNSGAISKVAYSLFLNSLEQSKGSLLFGAVDHSLYQGQLYTVPLVNIYSKKFTSKPLEFDVTVNGVGLVGWEALVQKKTLTQTKFPAVLDSGSELMQLPPGLSDEFADSVGAVWNKDLGWYVMQCPTQKQMEEAAFVFDFNGAHIYTPISNFVLTTSDPNACLLGMIKFTSNGGIYNNYAILGDVVLSSMYTVFDLENYEVSIAQANFEGVDKNRDVENIVSTVPGAIKAPGYYSTWTTWKAITGYTDTGPGLFTNEKEVNPWFTSTLATSIFSNSSTASLELSSRSSFAFATRTVCSSASISSSYSAPSSITSLSTATSTSYLKCDSALSTANFLLSQSPPNTVSTNDTPSVASKHSSFILTTNSAQKNVSTTIMDHETTTLITVTSCEPNACFTTISTAVVHVATKHVKETITKSTTYCPLVSGSSMLSRNTSKDISVKYEFSETDGNTPQSTPSTELSTSASFLMTSAPLSYSTSSQASVVLSTPAAKFSTSASSQKATLTSKITASTEANDASTPHFSVAMLLAAFALAV
ncbi:hypothetical protein ACO0RG_002550 [Hanseniaspora osmophila]